MFPNKISVPIYFIAYNKYITLFGPENNSTVNTVSLRIVWNNYINLPWVKIVVIFAHVQGMFYFVMLIQGKIPITVTEQSKAWIVFARSNAGMVGSNPNQGMDVCIVCVYSVFVLFYV
jgi:hypothetical protein